MVWNDKHGLAWMPMKRSHDSAYFYWLTGWPHLKHCWSVITNRFNTGILASVWTFFLDGIFTVFSRINNKHSPPIPNRNLPIIWRKCVITSPKRFVLFPGSQGNSQINTQQGFFWDDAMASLMITWQARCQAATQIAEAHSRKDLFEFTGSRRQFEWVRLWKQLQHLPSFISWKFLTKRWV
jgi:hypothetical protein